MLTLINTPIFQHFMATLDAQGREEAIFDSAGAMPPGAVGIIMSYACALPGPWNYASNGLNVEIVP